MASFSRQQLMDLWVQAGGDSARAAMAASIALAESSGVSDAVSKPNTNGSTDYGLWQINSVHGAQATTDPLANAKAAVAISNNGANWRPWSTAWSDSAGGTRGGTYIGNGDPMALPGIRGRGEGSIPFGPGLNAQGQSTVSANVSPEPGRYTTLATRTNASPMQLAISRYGLYAQYLNDPEWGPLIQAAAGQVAGPDGVTATRDEAWLEGQLSQTAKWQTTSDTARQFDFTEKTDPASAARDVQKNLYSIRAYARASGITLDDATLNDLAHAATRLGWSTQEMHDNTAAHFSYISGQTTGVAGADVAELKRLAGEYGIPIADSTLGSWVTNMVQGKSSKDDFVNYAAGMAKTMYPTIATQLDQGLTTSQVFDPYRQQAAKLLGISADSINLSDPKWNRALTAPPPQPDASGKQGAAPGTPMNMWQWEQTIRSDGSYGYQYTQNARDEKDAVLEQLGKTFGKLGS